LVYGTWTDTWEDWGSWYQGQWDAINAGQYKQTIKFTPYPVQPTEKVKKVRPKFTRNADLYDGAGEYIPSAVGINIDGSGFLPIGVGGNLGLDLHLDFANPENTGLYIKTGGGLGMPGGGASGTAYMAWGTRDQPWEGPFLEVGGADGIAGGAFTDEPGKIKGVEVGIGTPGGSGTITYYHKVK
jgi:hypothetical protein